MFSRILAGAAAVSLTIAAACAAPEIPAASRPASADVVLHPEHAVIRATVPRHATLDSLLRQHRLSTELVEAAVRSATEVFNPRRLRADRPYRLVLSLDGFLREFEYEIDADRFLRIVNRDRQRPEVLEAEVLPFEKQSTVTAVRGTIDAAHPSLVAAIEGAGENIHLALALAEIFGGQVDFNSDMKPGDRFEVLFEKSTRDGAFAGYGAVLGATFVADGREHEAYRWVDPASGGASYYDGGGRSLKRFFLISPLKFEPRITSSFSRRRMHPVHHVARPHLGVDYAAPHGAAVVAVASGTVVSARWAGAGGNQVHIRHERGLETFYLHLSSFAPGIRPGARVEQNQVVGRVGATGSATGPHLDFRLRRNGAFVDPVTERRRQPPGEPIAAHDRAAFADARETVLQQLAASLPADAPRQHVDAARAAVLDR